MGSVINTIKKGKDCRKSVLAVCLQRAHLRSARPPPPLRAIDRRRPPRSRRVMSPARRPALLALVAAHALFAVAQVRARVPPPPPLLPLDPPSRCHTPSNVPPGRRTRRAVAAGRRARVDTPPARTCVDACTRAPAPPPLPSPALLPRRARCALRRRWRRCGARRRMPR